MNSSHRAVEAEARHPVDVGQCADEVFLAALAHQNVSIVPNILRCDRLHPPLMVMVSERAVVGEGGMGLQFPCLHVVRSVAYMQTKSVISFNTVMV